MQNVKQNKSKRTKRTKNGYIDWQSWTACLYNICKYCHHMTSLRHQQQGFQYFSIAYSTMSLIFPFVDLLCENLKRTQGKFQAW